MRIIKIEFSGFIAVDLDASAALEPKGYCESDISSLSEDEVINKLNKGELYVDFVECYNSSFNGELELKFSNKNK